MDNILNLMGLIDATPMCIKLFDGKGNIIFVNKFGRKEHHLPETGDITGWDWMGTIKKEYQDEVKSKFAKILTGSPTEYLEFQHTPEGSDHLWCSGALASVKDEHGAISNILFYSIDISAKKEEEKRLMENMQEVEKINKFMIGREVKMVELKKEIEKLKEPKV